MWHGTLIVAVLIFVAAQTGWSFAVEGRRHAIDRLATTWSTRPSSSRSPRSSPILGTVIVKGLAGASAPSSSPRRCATSSPRAEGGGVYHALVGTLEQVGIAALIGVPIGILAAIYLVEYGRGEERGSRASISFFVDVMTGVPSIVAGLFVYTACILTLGMQRSGSPASIALAILMIPVIVRSTEEMLQLVPNELREASYALGVPSGAPSSRSSCPPRSRASSPA